MIVEFSNSLGSSDLTLEETSFGQAKTPVAAFVALLAFLVVLIVRPAEIMPALGPLRLALASFGLALVLWLFSGQRTVLLRPVTNRFALALLACMLISVPFSVWRSRSLEELVIFAKQLTVFFLIVNVLQNKVSVTQLLSVLVFALSIHAVVVLKRYLANEVVLDRVFGMSGGAFSDPNDLALSFVMIFPVTLHLALRQHRLWKRCFWGVFVLLFPAAVIATQSRGGLLGLMVATGLVVIESKRRLSILAAMTVCGLIVLVATPTAFDRYETIRDYQQDESALTRLTIWKAGLRMWADHPIVGVGVGAFPIAYGNTYRDPAFPLATWYDAHSSPIKVLAELGVLGFVAWSGMIAAGLYGLFRCRRHIRFIARETQIPDVVDLAALCQALRASLIGYLVCCIFLSRSYDWMLMLFLGISVVCVRFAREIIAAYAEDPYIAFDGDER